MHTQEHTKELTEEPTKEPTKELTEEDIWKAWGVKTPSNESNEPEARLPPFEGGKSNRSDTKKRRGATKKRPIKKANKSKRRGATKKRRGPGKK